MHVMQGVGVKGVQDSGPSKASPCDVAVIAVGSMAALPVGLLVYCGFTRPTNIDWPALMVVSAPGFVIFILIHIVRHLTADRPVLSHQLAGLGFPLWLLLIVSMIAIAIFGNEFHVFNPILYAMIASIGSATAAFFALLFGLPAMWLANRWKLVGLFGFLVLGLASGVTACTVVGFLRALAMPDFGPDGALLPAWIAAATVSSLHVWYWRKTRPREGRLEGESGVAS
jgi:hypothetical protein